MILVDSNVIIDVLTKDASWHTWSEAALSDAADNDEVAINPIIYAEIAAGFATMAELDRHLAADAFRRLPLPYAAGFVAGGPTRNIGGAAVCEPHPYPISISALMQPSRASAF
jgi:predicted nucleic acid-binding protein